MMQSNILSYIKYNSDHEDNFDSNQKDSDFILTKDNKNSVREKSFGTNVQPVFKKDEDGISSRKIEEERINGYKNIVVRMLNNEEVVVGYTSQTETYLTNLLESDLYLTKEVLNRVHKECFHDEKILQKFIEIMSNLDYEILYPTNTILALGCINHKNVAVQEAAIASYEKWDDKGNLSYLQHIHYSSEWLEKYAKEVIDYLESC